MKDDKFIGEPVSNPSFSQSIQPSRHNAILLIFNHFFLWPLNFGHPSRVQTPKPLIGL
jgi:hypothetical protein